MSLSLLLYPLQHPPLGRRKRGSVSRLELSDGEWGDDEDGCRVGESLDGGEGDGSGFAAVELMNEDSIYEMACVWVNWSDMFTRDRRFMPWPSTLHAPLPFGFNTACQPHLRPLLAREHVCDLALLLSCHYAS